MSKDEQIAALKAALKWVLDNHVVWQRESTLGGRTYPARLEDAGCGCCSDGPEYAPDDILATVLEIMQ